VIFRDGVSEGQYHMVLSQELPQVKQACGSLHDCHPSITVLVGGKRHNTRFLRLPRYSPGIWLTKSLVYLRERDSIDEKVSLDDLWMQSEDSLTPSSRSRWTNSAKKVEDRISETILSYDQVRLWPRLWGEVDHVCGLDGCTDSYNA
jgi:hypothetical protein